MAGGRNPITKKKKDEGAKNVDFKLFALFTIFFLTLLRIWIPIIFLLPLNLSL